MWKTYARIIYLFSIKKSFNIIPWERNILFSFIIIKIILWERNKNYFLHYYFRGEEIK